MKRFTVVTILFTVGILAVLAAFQVFSATALKSHESGNDRAKTNPVSDKLPVPVTGVEARAVAPVPIYDASGRIVSLNPNGSNTATVILAPVANVKIAPVYDASGAVVSDPSGTTLNSNH